jgi:hypothetical protein
VQGAQVSITFLYFSDGSAYFSATLDTAAKKYEIYVDAAKLTRQGGVKLNGDYDGIPGEAEDGAYVYVGNGSVIGMPRWTNSRRFSIYYTGDPAYNDAGVMTKLGQLNVSTFTGDTLASYKGLIEGKLKLYQVNVNGSKKELAAPTLTWNSSSFDITTTSTISRSDREIAYLELVLTACDQIESPLAYGYKKLPNTYDNSEKTKRLNIIYHNGSSSYKGVSDVYGAADTITVAESGTSTSIILAPQGGYTYTKLNPEDVKVLRLPKFSTVTNTDQQPTQFQVLTPEIQTIPGSESGQVAQQVLIVPKQESASYYYLVAIKYNTDIKSGASAIAGYFGSSSPYPAKNVSVKVHIYYSYMDDAGQTFIVDQYPSIPIPIPAEYWLWPSVLLNDHSDS